jgi:hypothetical protein
LFEVGGAVLWTGTGATGTSAGPAVAGVVAGSVVAGVVDAGAGAAGTLGVVLVADVEAADPPAARDPMIPRKPPTESNAVTVLDRAAGCRRCGVGLSDMMRPSVRSISQSLLRAH